MALKSIALTCVWKLPANGAASDQSSRVQVCAFISAPHDVELWCEFPPKSESTAAPTAVIDGQSATRGFAQGPIPFVFTDD